MKILFLIISVFISQYSFCQGWNAQNSGTINTLTEIYFTSANKGWMCGSNGLIKVSTNGGINWISQTSNTSETLWALYFINEATGWVTGNNGLIKFTSDSGTNWNSQNSGTFVSLWYPHFINPIQDGLPEAMV
ncbi:MAG TPA: YCF48-related protein [Ignavibacteria bacterium]|nr:YCF48-related protein [Ignavibacteria bacterium]